MEGEPEEEMSRKEKMVSELSASSGTGWEWAGELATTLTVGMGGSGAIGGGPACEFRGDSATVGTIWVFRGSILRSGRNGL